MMTSDRPSTFEADLARASQANQDFRRWVIIGFATVAGASALMNFGPAMGGSFAAAGRMAMGLFGLGAMALLWQRAPFGWMLAALWAMLQIPVFAWSPDGSPTLQAVSFVFGMTNSQQVNGDLVGYSQVGINLVGIIFTMLIYRWRRMLER